MQPAVARVSKVVVGHHGNATHSTAVAAAGSLMVQDDNSSDIQVSEFIHIPNSQHDGFVEDFHSLIQDLISNQNVMSYVRGRPGFQALEARLQDSSYEIEQLPRDVLSLSHGPASTRLITELSAENINDDIFNQVHSQLNDSGTKFFQETTRAREWLRERMSKENLELFFKRLESCEVNIVDGIRLSIKRASDETPGLLSLLSSTKSSAASNILRSSDQHAFISNRYTRRQSNGEFGSPPRERMMHEQVAKAAPLPRDGSEASDPLATAIVIIATAIMLARSIKKGPIVDKLIQFTRRVTNWIASHWRRQ